MHDLPQVVVREINEFAAQPVPVQREHDRAAQAVERCPPVLLDGPLVNLDAQAVLGFQQGAQVPPRNMRLRVGRVEPEPYLLGRPGAGRKVRDAAVVFVDDALHGLAAEADRILNVGRVDVAELCHRCRSLPLRLSLTHRPAGAARWPCDTRSGAGGRAPYCDRSDDSTCKQARLPAATHRFLLTHELGGFRGGSALGRLVHGKCRFRSWTAAGPARARAAGHDGRPVRWPPPPSHPALPERGK